MGFFEKALSSIGIGSAKVNTVLSQPNVCAGDILHGTVHIVGGSVEQTINKISVCIMTDYLKEVDDRKVRYNVVLHRIVVADRFDITPGEKKDIPFSIAVPEDAPISMHKRNVWLDTELDVSFALDPKDRDYITVLPNRTLETILDATMQTLGFRLREVESQADRRHGSRYGFTQEFEFVPTTQFRGYLDELEMIFAPTSQGIEIYMQIDRRVRGIGSFLKEAAGLDESNSRLLITHHDAAMGQQHVARIIEDTISRYIR